MNPTDLSVFLTTAATIISLIFVVFSFLRVNRKIEKFEGLGETLEQLFRYEEDAEGNVLVDARLTKLLESFALSLSSHLGQNLKMSFLGQLSGKARLDNGLKGALAADVIENKFPLLQLAGDIFGVNTISYIKKHPDAIGQLMQLGAPLIDKYMRNNGQGFTGNGVMK